MRNASCSSFARKPLGVKVGRIAAYAVLILLAFCFLFPYLYLICTSFMTPEDLFEPGFHMLPIDDNGHLYLTFENYSNAMDSLRLATTFVITILICVVNTALNLLLNAMAGYALARFEFAGKKVVFPLILASMTIPGAIMTIPNLIICQFLGVIDTIGALILPFVMSIYNVFLMRQQFLGLSKDLEEAAEIDGANPFKVFFTICLPLVSPMLIVLGITTFMWNYNNFMWTLLAIPTNTDIYTLSRALGELVSAGSSDPNRYPQMLAGSVITSLPLVLIFFFLQRYILEGISLGGVKE